MAQAKKNVRAAAGGRISRVDDMAVIGWREWIGLPMLGIDRIKAKIDSGARTSTLHAFDVQTFSDKGSPHVSFAVHPRQRHREPAVECVAEIRDQRMIRSSSGDQQQRYVIETEACMGEFRWSIELTLANRDLMGFRMLLGREAIRRRFLLDPNRSFLAGRSHADVTTIFTTAFSNRKRSK